MTFLVSIGNTSYSFIEDTLSIKRKLDEIRRCQLTVLDYAGTTTFTYLEKITITDSSLGTTLYAGFIIDDKLDKSTTYPDPTILHQLDCIDNMHIPAKRTSNRIYATPTLAGKIAVDMVSDVLGAEGVLATYATQTTTTTADWNTGNDQNVTGMGTIGDGDLELLSSASLSATYNSTAQWNTGTYSNTAAGTYGDISLIGQTRNWNDGKKTQQTLWGNGSPTDGTAGGQYQLSCTKQSETRSELVFAGTWGNGTIEVDVGIGADIPKAGLTWNTASSAWGNADGSWAYALEFTSTQIELRKGQNSSGGGSTSSLGLYTFSPKLAYGTYRLRVVVSGSTFTAYVNGTQYLSATDGSYSGPGYIALRNRNGDSVTVTFNYDNFGVMQATSGTWISPGQALDAITTIASTIISWDTSLSAGGTIKVETSTNNGSTYSTATNGGAIPGLTKGGSGAGLTLKIRVTLSNTTTATMPDIKNLQWAVFGGYVASGTRSTAPLGIDTMVRANQSGFGTAFDGQTWGKTGTGTDSIASNEATIANTTGDCYEILGNNSWTDMDATVRFSLSASTISAGIALRYIDVNNYFRVVASTTQLIASKNVASTITTIATVSKTITAGLFYYLRLRVFGTGPATIQARVWLSGTLEPVTWDINTTS